VKNEGKFEIHVHCPHFARVVKQRNIPNFDEWYEHKFHGKCTYFAFGGYVSVTENGDLIPCFYTDLSPTEHMQLGNIRNKTLQEAWKDVKKSAFYRSFQDRNLLKGKCNVCEYRELCGGCRNRAYACSGGDMYAEDPACPYIPEALRKNNNP